MTSNLNGNTERPDVEKEPSSHDDLQKVSEFFETNASIIERWLKEKAPDEVVNQISSILSKHRITEKEHRSSVTSELYQQWLSKSPLKVNKKKKFIKERLSKDYEN
jgi:mevalonate pyrophosphate decarboxylase